jgi:hypothetical protein
MLDRLGTENLLYIAAGTMVLLLPLIARLERASRNQAVATPGPAPESALKLLKDYRHIKLIGVIICASVIADRPDDPGFPV